MAILSRPGSGVAKTDSSISRASALADEPLEDEFYRPPANTRSRRSVSATDTRAEETFLRARRRVPVRRSWFPLSRIGRIAAICGIVLGLGVVGTGCWEVRNFLYHDSRFEVESSSNIQINGNSELDRSQLLEIFGADIGRNIFFVPLKDRRKDLEQIPWVERATVMRLLPNQIRVTVVERTPVAFVRKGNEIGLVDGNGVLLDLPPEVMAQRRYSFPVVSGINEVDPLPLRAERMKLYRRFLTELDGSGEKLSEQLSEVDLANPEDVRVLLPSHGTEILTHFGSEQFLQRYRNYKAHIDEWMQQYPHLASVDLRYETQVVLEMTKGSETPVNQSAAAQATATAAPAKPSAPATKKAAAESHASAKTHHPAKGKR